ncbi:MAG: hypothetical protein K2Y51_16550 [Gammaproteobacteria bacterium]|jgi:hypothetical protein|nr:hypothetical protein [Gammaproteobacteria bacterium]
MLNRLFTRQIAAFESHYHYDMGYAHRLLRASRGAFLRFSLFARLAQHREGVAPAPYFAARLAATLAEDCGPCTQLVLRMAEEAGVDAPTLRAIVGGDLAALDADTALALRYARAVLAHAPAADELCAAAEARFGERGLASLALAIAWTRVYPTLKRGLGAAHACERLEIGGQYLAPAAVQRAL